MLTNKIYQWLSLRGGGKGMLENVVFVESDQLICSVFIPVSKGFYLHFNMF